MINVHFTADQYKDGLIKTYRTSLFFKANCEHKLKNGQRCIQQINVISPTGVQFVFDLVGEHGEGLRYKNEKMNIRLNLLNP